MPASERHGGLGPEGRASGRSRRPREHRVPKVPQGQHHRTSRRPLVLKLRLLRGEPRSESLAVGDRCESIDPQLAIGGPIGGGEVAPLV